ncbi:MAG: TIGR01906 family membrane protein [Chloroflexota bacterium]
MRIFPRVAKGLFILVLPFLLLSVSIATAVNSLWLYEYGFQKFQVSHTAGLPPGELEKAARGIISYFNSGEEYINVTVIKEGKPLVLFNQREVEHLKDVKSLIELDYRILLVALVYALMYAGASLVWRKPRYWRELAGGLVGGGSLTIALMLTVGLMALANFDQFFLQFHLLSFANDLWQLDPTRDYLIMLFPGGFWQDATLFIVVATAAGAAVLGATGWMYLKSARSALPG